MRNPTLILAGLLPVVVLLVLLETQETSAQICPLCSCPPVYSPVCGKRRSTGEEHVFSSKCVLECNNQCIQDKFTLKNRGRCVPKRKNRKPVVIVEENSTLNKDDRQTAPKDLKLEPQ